MGLFDLFRGRKAPDAVSAQAPAQVAYDTPPGERATVHGFASVLLDVELESSPESLRRLLEPVASAVGAELRLATDAPTIHWAEGVDLLLVVGSEPFARELTDVRFWPNNEGLGKSFVCVLRTTPSAAIDGWREGGFLRQRLRFLSALLDARGVGVIAHAAGNVAWPKREWQRRLDDVDDLSRRAFTALVDVGMAGTVVFTQGMDAIGLLDVKVDTAELGLSDEEAYERAQAAALFACHTMTFEHRILSSRERLAVPVGVEISCGPLPGDNPGLSFDLVDTFEVSRTAAHLQLTPAARFAPIHEHWSATTSQAKDFPLPAYRALLEPHLQQAHGSRVARLSFDRDELPQGVPEHEVWVMARPNGAFSTVTCGVGRRVQAGGSEAAENAHVELIVTLPTHHPRLANFLSYVGRVLHAKDPHRAPWGPEHRIELEGRLERAGFPFLVLARSGKLEPRQGPPICLYTPIPMTLEERNTIPIADVPSWIRDVGPSVAEPRWTSFIRHGAA